MTRNPGLQEQKLFQTAPLSAALAAMKALRCSSYDSSIRFPFFFFSGEKAGSACDARVRAASMACSTAFSPSVPLLGPNDCQQKFSDIEHQEAVLEHAEDMAGTLLYI